MAHPERVTHAEALDIVRAYALAPGYPATNLAMRRTRFAAPEGIDVPVTLAWGEHDRLVRPPAVPPPGWRTVLLPDCGHLAMWDDPDARRARDPRDRERAVSATPASAIAPPTAVRARAPRRARPSRRARRPAAPRTGCSPRR